MGFDSISMGLGKVFPRLSSTFCSVVVPEPLEQFMICTRMKFSIAFLLVWAIGKSKHSLLVYRATSDIRSSWFANLLEHPKGVRNLVTSHRLAEYPSEDSCILEGLCGTLCAEEGLGGSMMNKGTIIILTGMAILREQRRQSVRSVRSHGAIGSAHGSGTKSTWCKQTLPRL